MSKSPLLSVVFAAYSIEQVKNIADLLNGLKAQSYKNLEVVFVSDGSVEVYQKVKELIADQPLPFPVQVLLNSEERGASAARNLGMKNCHGDIIALVDDDTIPFPTWAEELIATFKDESIIGVTGPALPLWESKDMEWFPEEFSWMWGGTSWYECKDDGIREIRNVGGMNCAFLREAFEKAGLYLPQLGPKGSQRDVKFYVGLGEEVEFSLRVRKLTDKRIVFNPRAKVYHRVPRYKLKWRFLLRRAYRMGYARAHLKHLHPETSFNLEYDLLRRIFTNLIFRTPLKLFSHPLAAIKSLLVAALGTLFTILGYVAYHFRRER